MGLRSKLTLIKSTSSKVQAEVGLSSKNFTPLEELVSSELVGLGAQPSQLRPFDSQQLCSKLSSGRDILGKRPMLLEDTTRGGAARFITAKHTVQDAGL